MTDDLRSALVTGAGRGLGLALTRALLGRGYRVFTAARHPERSEALSELREAHGERVVPVTLDVGEPLSVAAAAEAVGAVTDALHVLVNNAGINSRSVPTGQGNVRLGSLEPEGFLTMMRVNALGPALVTQAMLPLLAAGHGKVVNISSWLGSIAGKQSGGNYGYAASKAALNMVGRAMAFDLAEQGVVSFQINPGWVQTDMGGERAKLTPEESAEGILDVAERITLDHAGEFLQWDGTPHEW
ncbi:MAG: SDR family oxidoreductase [Myxococcota bacterium]